MRRLIGRLMDLADPVLERLVWHRMRCEVFKSGDHRVRVSRREGKVFAVEVWSPPPAPGQAYDYKIFKVDQ